MGKEEFISRLIDSMQTTIDTFNKEVLMAINRNEVMLKEKAFSAYAFNACLMGVDIPFFKDADYICVVPSSHAFVREIVSGLKGFDFSDISSSLSWDKKSELKNAESLEDKLDALLNSHLMIADDVDLEGKNILLVDDLYKSGLTMQYVAMMLKNAGCSRVFGLTLVKSLGNN